MIANDLTRKKPIDWSSSFLSLHKSPYGTYVLYNELKNIFPKSEVINTNLSTYEFLINDYNIDTGNYSEDTNYLFLSNTINFGEQSSEELFYFVGQGNNVFMAARDFPEYIQDSLHFEVNYSYDITPEVTLKFANPNLKKTKFYYEKAVENVYFNKLDSTNITVLGYNEVDNIEHVNFIKIKYGEGNFILNTQPYAFTNYHMLKSDHAAYVSACFSYLPDYNIVWDDRNKSKTEEIGTPLRYLLSKPTLKYAWFTSLFAIFLFMIFRAKRRQRIVPIIEKLQNTSLAFAKTMGNLYYQEGEPKNIVSKKITYFLEHIRNKYMLDTQNLNADFKKRLHLKTGISKEEIDRLVNYIVILNNSKQIKEHSLIILNKHIENFYQKIKL